MRWLAAVLFGALAASSCSTASPTSPAIGADPTLEADLWELAHGRGTAPLRRVVAPRVSLVPSAEIAGDANALEALRTAAAAVTSATGGAVVFEVGAAAGVSIDVDVDPTAVDGNACVFSGRFTGDGVTIIGGRVSCASLYWAGRPPVVTHELLHAYGLHHSTIEGDIMCTCSGDPNRTISARETRVVRAMLRLAPGTPAPTR